MAFEPVTVIRSSEQVARQIERQICEGGFILGQKLPTERELCEQFAVSRSVIREAVKTLAALGLVESRQGSGIFVQRNSMPVIARALTLLVTPKEQPVQALYDLREPLEARTAYNAACHRTPDQLAAIEAALADNLSSDSDEALNQSNHRLHLAICEAAGNPYFTLLIDTIMRLHREVATAVMRPNTVDTLQAYQASHRSIVAAITDGDPEAAAEAMSDHIRGIMRVTGDFLVSRQFEHGRREETTPSALTR